MKEKRDVNEFLHFKIFLDTPSGKYPKQLGNVVILESSTVTPLIKGVIQQIRSAVKKNK